MKYTLLSLLLLLLLGGCKDVFEQDITNKTITVIAPTEGAQSVVYKQLFWWEKLEGAAYYSIQIATPSFDNMTSILTDTIVTDTKFYKTLSPGQYQWRIRAENGGYKTNYQTYNLTMNVSSLDLQTVNLTAPANNTYKNTSLFNFSWEKITGATKYIIEIDTVSENFTNPIKKDSTSNNIYSYTFAKEGDYKWRVKGKDNSNNETSWSDIFYTGYYTTAPAVPTLLSPTNNSTVTPTTVTFSWNDVPKAQTYILHLYRNNADTTVASAENYSVSTPATSKSISFTSTASGAIIYWRVSATDKAGNQSALSAPIRKITVQ